jgi:hypothetical protein
MIERHSGGSAAPRRKDWRELRRFLTDRRVLGELHHLFWRAPFTNNGNRDEGWMCREHAFFTACLAALLGQRSVMVWGRLALVGETESGGTSMLRVDTHAWSAVEGIGFFDPSLDLRTGRGPGWARWPGSCLAGSAFFPNPAAVAFELYSADERLKWE